VPEVAGKPIEVIDPAPEHEALCFVCLEDWPGADIADAGDHKARWCARLRGQGLRVKLALQGRGLGAAQRSLERLIGRRVAWLPAGAERPGP
jgi:hypothetical protein